MLDLLHGAVEQIAEELAAHHGSRLRCRRGCASCCVDDLSVWEVEAAKIARDFPHLLRHQQPAPAGGCAFLDQGGACRIYDSRPYVCRTQGLPLRWVEEVEGQWQEWRDICPLNEGPGGVEGLEGLEAQECWTLGSVEEKLWELQQAWGAGETRVKLRDLFGGMNGGSGR